MRMSCNGCRILRKGCSDDCSIRPCLQSIKSPEAQANATVFLAKFYGRAGLLNLINAGPQHLRPAIFRSLLYEACGRIVNPIYGSAGLFCSGNWQLCEAAVEAVLSGSPISQISSDSAVGGTSPPLKACDIRHVSKHHDSATSLGALHRVKRRSKFKRAGVKPKSKSELKPESGSDVDEAAHVIWSWSHKEELEFDGCWRHDSEMSHPAEKPSSGANTAEADTESVETVEVSLVKRDERIEESDVELELTLGLEPIARTQKVGPILVASNMNRQMLPLPH